MPDKILVVDDEVEIADLIEVYLNNENYSVFKFYSAKEALDCINTTNLDLAILDVMLPDIDGYTLCQKIRTRHTYPIIMLTAKDGETDKINGLTLGADDYMTKPFSLLVLISKVNALMRRAGQQEGQILLSDGIEVNCLTMQVYRQKEPVILSKKELQLLICLMEHEGTVMTKEQILEMVWDREGQFVDENTVTVNISRLKSKLHTNAIENVRGLGYIWTDTVTKK